MSLALAVLADNCQMIDEHDCIMVSPGITIEEKARLGLATPRHRKTPALEMAFDKQGRKAKVAVLRQGGDILPLVRGESGGGEG